MKTKILLALEKNKVFLVEFLLILTWTIIVGLPYLDFDKQVIPAGREWGSAVMSHHIWDLFKSCGACILWNGYHSGGFPTVADPFTSALHPIVIVTTLLWGVVNGAKLALVIAIFTAGIAQWIIAYELGLGPVPRVWSAAVAIAGGHLTARMEIGSFGMLFSVAMVSLLFGFILRLANRKDWTSTVLLAIVGASAILAGQLYSQVGFLWIAPACLFLFTNGKDKSGPVWKKFIVAFALAILLAGLFIAPFIHSLNRIAKSGIEFDFRFAQPFSYLPLNLIIGEADFFRNINNILGRSTGPSISVLYIGWVAVILAILGATKFSFKNHRHHLFLSIGILLGFLFASAIPLRFLAKYLPSIAGLRFTPLFVLPAIPLIIGFSACGLQWLIQSQWSTYRLNISDDNHEKQVLKFRLTWLILIPLIWGLYTQLNFSRNWTETIRTNQNVLPVLNKLKTDYAAWVLPPFGEQYWNEQAAHLGLKIADNLNGFHIANQNLPEPHRIAIRAESADPRYTIIGTYGGVSVFQAESIVYAYVSNGVENQPCQAMSTGGYIEVDCKATINGQLIVSENMWAGWRAWLDGKPVPLIGTDFLKVNINSGAHQIIFRFVPLDAYFGMILSLIGIGLCVYLWRRSQTEKIESPEQADQGSV